MNSKWLTYQDKRILYCDYRNLGIDDLDKLQAELSYVEELLKNEPVKSVLSITDVRGSVASIDAVNAVKKASVNTEKFVSRQAVVGVSGLKRIFFDTIVRLSGQNAHIFEDLESAQNWLVAG